MAYQEAFENRNESEKSLEALKAIIIQALEQAFLVHNSLGEAGEETSQKNQFGETVLRADLECEQAVLNSLREADLPIRVISEEHGLTELSKNPRYLGVLDGLDGSGVYKKERGRGRYGTMFGIFDTLNPTYKDYLVSGIMEHSTKRLFIATKGGGAFLIENGISTPIYSSGITRLDKAGKINIDEFFDINKEIFSRKLKGFQTQCLKASCAHYADVAYGAADLALECTRKGNLEIAVAYGLESEAGAVMVDIEGNDIGDKKYLQFGQTDQLPIITAATLELAQELLERIKK